MPRSRRTSPSLAAYDVDLGGPGIHRGLPSTTLTFVLAADEPLDIGWRGAPDSRAERWSTVSGLHAHPAEIHHDGHQRGHPAGADDGRCAGAARGPGGRAGGAAGRARRGGARAAAPARAARRDRRRPLAGDAWSGRWSPRSPGTVRREPRAEVGRALATADRGRRRPGGRRRGGLQPPAPRPRWSAPSAGSAPKEVQRVARFDRSRRRCSVAAARSRRSPRRAGTPTRPT